MAENSENTDFADVNNSNINFNNISNISNISDFSDFDYLNDYNIPSGKKKRGAASWETVMFFLTMTVSALAAVLYQKTVVQLAGIVILAGVGFGVVWFLIGQGRENKSFLYDNGENIQRFAVIYLICLGGSVLFPLLPVGGWPFQVIFIGLMLFSSQMVGLSAGCTLLMITVLLWGGSSSTFFIYFISGFVGIAVFSHVSKTFKIWTPTLISLLIQMVCLSIQEVLFANEALSFQMFFIPEINILVNFILLMILLKYFSVSIIYKERDRYMDINDPEYPLLVELKACSKDEYFHAIHTAYLCDRTAKKLKLDDAVVKACGYYHRIGMIRGNNSWETVRNILRENRFPVEVQNILREYLDENEKILSKETVILFFCDTVISSISYMFSKNPKIEMDYKKVISAILNKKIESGIIDGSNLSFGELQEMKKILAEEKLYYDFLR